MLMITRSVKGTARSWAKSHVAAELDQLVGELVGDRVDGGLEALAPPRA